MGHMENSMQEPWFDRLLKWALPGPASRWLFGLRPLTRAVVGMLACYLGLLMIFLAGRLQGN